MTPTSDTLLERLKLPADGEAWNELVAVYSPLIRGWLRRDVMLDQEADDLVQEVLCVLVRKLPQFRREPRPGAFRRWLRGITVNCLREMGRARRAQPLALGESRFVEVLQQLEDPDSGLSRLWDQEHDAHVARQLMVLIQSEFAPATWTAFHRVAIDGAPAEQVARELGLSVNAVFIAKSRVLGRLRRLGAGLID
jgi:RNA polymerase sigma-70 factor (ECF subfamily)